MDESQITGAASSYARKYALNGLFAIDDNKDADATNKHEDEPETISEEQEIELRDLFTDKYGVADFIKEAKISKLSDLLAAKFKSAKKYIEEQAQ
jgi:hypothetical protein